MKNMNRPVATLLALLLWAAVPASTLAQEDAQVRKDLETVLALKGKPCGTIVELRRQAENDYLVSCKDGHRYRIFIAGGDRVVIEERG